MNRNTHKSRFYIGPFTFCRNSRTLFQSGCITWHFHHQSTRESASLHTHKHLLLGPVFILAILVGLYLIVHCGFNSRFPNGWWYGTSFQVFIFHLHALFSEMSLHIMEVNKDQAHDKSKGYLFWAHHSKKVRPSSLAFWQRLRARQRSRGALYWKKGKASDISWSLWAWRSCRQAD